MSTVFIDQGIWPQLTKAVRGSRQRDAVAVAYFGKGASNLLPLHKGSRLVVDASEHSVKSGQTCPDDLIKLVKRGVKVYSVPNLHAKVFVLGRAAYIGSANVSNNSANKLVEAVIRTTEPRAVRAARSFVEDHCLYELSPTVLKRLSKLYRPPRIPGGKSNGPNPPLGDPTLPRLFLAQIFREDWSEREQGQHAAGEVVAKKYRKHPRSWEQDSFSETGECKYQRGDVIIQVTEEDDGKFFVSPPGNVLHVRRTRGSGNRQKSFVYLEIPNRRRRELKVFARSLGRAELSPKWLCRNRLVRDPAFVQALLKNWSAGIPVTRSKS